MSRPWRIVVSKAGRLTLPKAVRERLNWKPGTKLTVLSTAYGVELRLEQQSPETPFFRETTIDEVFGSLGGNAKPLSIEEMDASIVAASKGDV